MNTKNKFPILWLSSKLVVLALILFLLGTFLYNKIPYILLVLLDFTAYMALNGISEFVLFFFGIAMWMLVWLDFYKITLELNKKEYLMIDHKEHKGLIGLYIAILLLFVLSYLIIGKSEILVNILIENYPSQLQEYFQTNIYNIIIGHGLYLLVYVFAWVFVWLCFFKFIRLLYIPKRNKN